MNWNNLKSNKCPGCSANLIKASSFPGQACSKCSFTISLVKFEKIVTDLYKPKRKRCLTYEENLGELNNLGREEMVEDFSNSRFLDI